jgi:deoxyribodipyrimidine photo-lyase
LIQLERIQRLNAQPVRKGRYVVYWMQASQRAEWNHALEYAIQQANELGQPIVAVFGLTDKYPEANERHYAFMLEGLKETQAAMEKRGIRLVVLHLSPEKAALQMGDSASLLVTDRGYLRIQKRWRAAVARRIRCRFEQVETDVVVPVEIVSNKHEYAAMTIRPKIHKHLMRYLVPIEEIPVERDSLSIGFDGFCVQNVDAALKRPRIDRSVRRQKFYVGGTSQARALLDTFIRKQLSRYADLRNDPSLGIQSNMSPYLHFGQISPVYIAMRVRNARVRSTAAKEAYLEELIVRRELSMNFVRYHEKYDSFEGLPRWASETLEAHANDGRDYVYTLEELEHAQTHDPYWNAAMREMVVTGKIHNYMRMYWGKKILEWSPTPRSAFQSALYLNNKYFLDGRDANSFAGVAWCFGKHDRPWGERPVFGKVRYMSDAGLRRKFDIDAYVSTVNKLES